MYSGNISPRASSANNVNFLNETENDNEKEDESQNNTNTTTTIEVIGNDGIWILNN